MLLLLLAAALLWQAGGRPIQRRPPPAPLPTRLYLTLETEAGATRASVEPGKEPSEPRPAAACRVGETPRIRWRVDNRRPNRPVTNVVVHFLVHRQQDAGEPIPSGPQKGSHADLVLGTDLAPGASTGGLHAVPMHEPGVYLVELELLDPQGNRRHYCLAELTVR